MNFLHGNDKKRIKSALNDKKRNIFQTLVTTATVFYVGGHSAASEGS
jgi:hypothetical protein